MSSAVLLIRAVFRTLIKNSRKIGFMSGGISLEQASISFAKPGAEQGSRLGLIFGQRAVLLQVLQSIRP